MLNFLSKIKTYLWTIGGAVILLLLSLLGIQTKRVEKQKAKVAEAENQIAVEQARLKRQQQAAEAKDLLLQKQKEQAIVKEENVVKIGKTEELPNEEKIEEQQEIVDNLTNLFNSRNVAK